MEYLIFQIQAPLSAWGETAVGEYRPSANYPSESALLGLLAAALGIDRNNESAHMDLQQSYSFAIGVQSAGRLLRDYHTSQVPGAVALKNRPHFTRRDELNVPKDDLNTILSTRDYRQDAACIISVHAHDGAKHSLVDLASALQKPHYILYLGRKSCPLSTPLWPQIINADHALSGMEKYRNRLSALEGNVETAPLERLVWSEGIESGCEYDLQLVRKDRLLSRKQWQFGDRIEFVALLGEK